MCPVCDAASCERLPPHKHVEPGAVRAFWEKYSNQTDSILATSYRDVKASGSTTAAAGVLHLLGDTGAFDHMMDAKEACRLGLRVRQLRPEDRVTVSTANGPVHCAKQTYVELTPGAHTPFTLLPDGQNMLSIGRYVIDYQYLFMWDGSHPVLRWYPMLVAPPNSGWPDIVFYVVNYVPRLSIMPTASAAPEMVSEYLDAYVAGTFGLVADCDNEDQNTDIKSDEEILYFEECVVKLNYAVAAGAYDRDEAFQPWSDDHTDFTDHEAEVPAWVVDGDSFLEQIQRPQHHQIQRPQRELPLEGRTTPEARPVSLSEVGFLPSTEQYPMAATQVAAGGEGYAGITTGKSAAPSNLSIEDMTRPFTVLSCDMCGLLQQDASLKKHKFKGKTLELCVGCFEEQQSTAVIMGIVKPNPAAAAPRDVRRTTAMRANLEGYVEAAWSKPLEYLEKDFVALHGDGPTSTLPPEWTETNLERDPVKVKLRLSEGMLGLQLDKDMSVLRGRYPVIMGDVLVKVNGRPVASASDIAAALSGTSGEATLDILRPRLKLGRDCVHAEDRPRLHKAVTPPRDCVVTFYTSDGKSCRHTCRQMKTLRTTIDTMPPWSQVHRRLVTDAKTGEVIEDIDVVHDHELHLFTAKGQTTSDRLNREARMKRKRHARVPKWTASRFGEAISADSVGRIDDSWHGMNHFSTGLDSHTGWLFADPLHSTTADETKRVWASRLAMCRREEVIWRIHTDGGPEFQAEFHEWCVANGIHHTVSIPHTPQNNSRLERAHGTVNAAIRSALHVSGLPLTFWDSAMMHSVFMLNRQQRWGKDGRLPTPFEMRYGKPYLGVDLVPFGCQASVVIPAREKEHKYGAKGEETIVVGYAMNGKGYSVIPVQLLRAGTPRAYDVEVPETGIVMTRFPARRMELPRDAEYAPETQRNELCTVCGKWRTSEPVTCPPCRAAKRHRKHKTDHTCAKQRCTCEDDLSSLDTMPFLPGEPGPDEPDGPDDGDEHQALADDLIEVPYDAPADEAWDEGENGDPPQGPDSDSGPDYGFFDESDGPSPIPAARDHSAYNIGGSNDGSFETSIERAYDALDPPERNSAFNFWESMTGGPTNASHRDGGAGEGPTTVDYAKVDKAASAAVRRIRTQRMRDQLELVPCKQSEKRAVARLAPPEPALLAAPKLALAVPRRRHTQRPLPDSVLCQVCHHFRKKYGAAGCVNWFTHQMTDPDAELPLSNEWLGYDQPHQSAFTPSRDAVYPAAVAQLYRLQKALDTDATGVKAAINKEMTKLIDKPPLGKAVFSEDDVVDKSVLIKRARKPGCPLIRLSKVLLKIYKKGTELPLHLQKWSARACLDGSWITDVFGKKASDQSPEERLESTPISLEGLRKLIFESCCLGNTIFAGDVTGAYLETKLGPDAPEIWVHVPDVLRRDKGKYKGKEPMVRLLKALYGLPRAGHDWDAAMRKRLLSKGWSALDNQNSIYAKTIGGKLCLMGVYVDDMIVSAPDELVERVRAELSGLFPVEWSEFKPATYKGSVASQKLDMRFLGVRVTITREGTKYSVVFSQIEYAQSIVDLYETKTGRKCKNAKTPSVKVDESLAIKSDSEGKYKSWSREILGKLLFLERCSRIDTIQAITHLCGRVCSWSTADDALLDRLMDYCNGTTKMCLEWDIDSRDRDNIRACLLTDADWATDTSTSKSVSSWNLTLIGPNTKATTSWGVRKMTFIARSTAEAEVGAFVAGLVAALLPALLFIESISAYVQSQGLPWQCQWRPTAKCDNNAACTALNSRLAGRLSLLAKSSRINLHWSRDQLRRSGIYVARVPTELNSSDLGSKALGNQTHWRLAYSLMSTCCKIYSDVVWEQNKVKAGWCPTGTVLGSPWED